MTNSPLDQVVQACIEALSQSPACLFSDFDGTLSHVAPTPDVAVLAPGAAEVIRSLNERLDGFVIVTGRAAQDAGERIGIQGVDIVGNHGLEHLENNVKTINPAAERQIAAIGSAVAAIEAAISSVSYRDRLVVENKLLSASVHYRLAPDPDEAREFLLHVIDAQAEAQSLIMTEGKLVIELRPKLAVNKGTAIEEFIQVRGLSGAVMLGDDVTDVDAFVAIRTARASGIAGVAVAVISPETHHSVLDTADYFVHGVDETVQLLHGVADGLIQAS